MTRDDDRPRIGITSGLSAAWRPGGDSWQPYADAVEAAGGRAIHLDPATSGREAAVLRELGALLIPGGKDVDLACYPNPPDLNGDDPEDVVRRFRMEPEPERDCYEIPLILAALEHDLPVLGICRGCQVLQVALGGRLVLDLETEIGNEPAHRAAPDLTSRHHALEIRPDSLLARILEPARFRLCNSRHHQAVRVEAGMTAQVSAVSPDDGIVEAIEVPGRRWAVGVQWHPERRADAGGHALYAPLFRALVESSRR